jgi:hypothetical protein
MPLQDRCWLEQEHNVVQTTASTTGHIPPFCGENGKDEFLTTRNAGRGSVLPLQDAQLLWPYQDLHGFGLLRSWDAHHEVEPAPHDSGTDEGDHEHGVARRMPSDAAEVDERCRV